MDSYFLIFVNNISLILEHQEERKYLYKEAIEPKSTISNESSNLAMDTDTKEDYQKFRYPKVPVNTSGGWDY